MSTPPLQFAAPNAIVSLFGKNFAPAGTSRAVTGQDLVNGAIPTSLAATCVVFGTTRAPMFLVTPTQINVQVPTLTAPATVNVQVLVNCDTANQTASNTASVLLQAAAPEFFYAQNNPNGRNPVAANDSVTGAAVGDPADLGAGFALAYPGESITLYCTGLGLSTPGFNAGELPPAGAPVPNLSVTIDDVALDASAILYAGIAPMNAGLYQINIVLPANLNTGDHTIGLAVKNAKSPGGAFLSVR